MKEQSVPVHPVEFVTEGFLPSPMNPDMQAHVNEFPAGMQVAKLARQL